MEFVDEQSALTALRSMFTQAGQARLAVAFWGAGAIERLGLDRDGLSLRIVCNLESGACNPDEIDRLMNLGSVTVRSDPRLHGKVYWTPSVVLIGSSNASTNGLAVEGTLLAGWAEANTLTDDPAIVAASLAWFEQRWSASHEISEIDLEDARRLWRLRTRGASPGTRFGRDLLGACHSAPDHLAWQSVKVCLWSEGLSDEGCRKLAADKRDNPALARYDVYEDWQNEIAAGDWLLDFQLGEALATFSGVYAASSPKIESGNLTYVLKKADVRLPGFPPLVLEKRDRKRIEKEAWTILRRFGGWQAANAIIPIRRVLELLDAKPATPDPRAFEEAMLDIYRRAKEIGDNPNLFRRMIADHGGLETARMLMRGQPSEGFTRLFLKGRPDLTVESLILEPEWRDLFTPDERRIAMARLGRR